MKLTRASATPACSRPRRRAAAPTPAPLHTRRASRANIARVNGRVNLRIIHTRALQITPSPRTPLAAVPKPAPQTELFIAPSRPPAGTPPHPTAISRALGTGRKYPHVFLPATAPTHDRDPNPLLAAHTHLCHYIYTLHALERLLGATKT